MTFGMIGLLGWACADPPGFAIVMGALATVPEPLWAVWGAVAAFWFGARELHKVRRLEVRQGDPQRRGRGRAGETGGRHTRCGLSSSGRKQPSAPAGRHIWGEARGKSEERGACGDQRHGQPRRQPRLVGPRHPLGLPLAPAQFACWWDA
jgi:hypothetical protein